MRKLQRSILRHKAYSHFGGIELFHQYWKTLRIRQGKWKFKSTRLNNQQAKANQPKKEKLFERLLNFLNKKGGKK